MNMKESVGMSDVAGFCKRYYVERKGTNSVKWDGMVEKFGENDLLPLWVADMDFKLPEAALEALNERVNHGVFGYSFVPDSYYQAFINWQKKRHNVLIDKNWIRFNTGVVNSFNYIIQMLTDKHDHVLILSPVYYPFYDAVIKNERQLSVLDIENKDQQYTIDFEQFEQKIIEDDVKVFLHCSPQNPIGKIWTYEELEQLFDICDKHGVKIISDEIHQDFARDKDSFISALALPEKYYASIFVLNSPSKTFNVASLLHSHLIIPDENNRKQYDDYAEVVACHPVSTLGMVAAEACYEHGEEWFEGVLEVIEYNYAIVKDYTEKYLPKARLAEKKATYLAWLDLSNYTSEDCLEELMQKQAKLAIDYGNWFGKNTENCIRINLATKPEVIEQAMKQLVKSVSCD